MHRHWNNPTTKNDSLSFCGAGFMGVYHVGVAACLQKYGCLPNYSSNNAYDDAVNKMSASSIQKLTGVSAGSLVSAAIAMGVSMDDSMNVLMELSRHARKHNQVMGCLSPGYSLLDELYRLMKPVVYDALAGGDEELFVRRVRPGNLRVGFTDVGAFVGAVRASVMSGGAALGDQSQGGLNGSSNRYIQEGYRYVDEFHTIDELLCSTMISSYIPGVTAPQVFRNNADENSVVKKSLKMLETSFQLRIKNDNGDVVEYESVKGRRKLNLIDGGIVNMFPIFDSNTTIVSIFSGDYGNKNHISPSEVIDSNSALSALSDPISGYKINLTKFNADMLRGMILNSSDEEIEQKYKQGWADAK